MNKEEIKELVKETFIENVMSNLDSALIFTYIQNLEEKNKQLQQERNKYKNIVEEIGEMIFNDDTYIHYDENIEDHYIYESDLIDAYKYLLEELENGDSNE